MRRFRYVYWENLCFGKENFVNINMYLIGINLKKIYQTIASLKLCKLHNVG